MAIKSVTQANLAEHVQAQRALGQPVASPAEVAVLDAKPPGDVIVGEHTETVSTAPDPGDKKPEKKPKPVQPRIDELTREKRELEEFAESEYTARLTAQRRIDELEKQIQSLAKPEVKEDPEPVRADYKGDDEAWIKARDEWNRKKAIRDFQEEQRKRDAKAAQDALIQELNERRERSVTSAKSQFEDFQDVVAEADRVSNTNPDLVPPDYVKATIWESEYGAHILYHLAKHPEEAKKIFRMRAPAAALALGRLETLYAKQPDAKDPPKELAPPPTTRAPAPMISVTSGSGEVPHDFTKPQSFKDYKQQRIEQIRKARGRH